MNYRHITDSGGYGIHYSLFLATARDEEEEAPSTDDTHSVVVVITLHSQLQVGNMFLEGFDRYSQALQSNGDRLFHVSAGNPTHCQPQQADTLQILGIDCTLYTNGQYHGSLLSTLNTAQKQLAGKESIETQDDHHDG